MFPNFNSCDKIKGSLEYNKRMIGMAAKKEGWTLIGRAPEPKREQKLCKIVDTIKRKLFEKSCGQYFSDATSQNHLEFDYCCSNRSKIKVDGY